MNGTLNDGIGDSHELPRTKEPATAEPNESKPRCKRRKLKVFLFLTFVAMVAGIVISQRSDPSKYGPNSPDRWPRPDR